MQAASASSFRMKSRLALSLSWVAGYTNVILFMMCGAIVVAHVTGNVTHLGRGLIGILTGAGGARREAGVFGYLVLTFFAGAVASALMTEAARRRGRRVHYVLPMAVEALLLTALAVGIALHQWGHIAAGAPAHFYWLSGAASLAMGLQNATITRISGAVVRTTHLTGVVTDLGLETVQYLLWARDKTRGQSPVRRRRVWRVSRQHPSVLRIALLSGIVGSFLFGVLAGTWALAFFPAQAMLPPVTFLLWMTWNAWRKPTADVREIDLAADAGHAGLGDAREYLPPELGLYRLAYPGGVKAHVAPDFQAWAGRVPRRWRVVILDVGPRASFDVEAVLDLSAAAQKLRAHGRDLILCGVRPEQYRAIHKAGLARVMGLRNFAPDLELALARGMNRVQELTGH